MMSSFAANSSKPMELLKHPKAQVTVLMAVYNGMPYLPKAVESILAQSLDTWQMIIVDDGSTDGSLDYLGTLNDSRIQILSQSHRGLVATLNRGLELCHTEYVARMDSDDIAYPQRLSDQLAFLENHPDVGLLGTQVERLGSARSAGHSRLACDHGTLDADLMAGRVAIYHPAAMFRTELVRRLGGYRNVPHAEDWDLYLRVAEVSRLANLPQIRLSYRIHGGSVCSTHLATTRTGVAYSCHCAHQRRTGRQETTYEEFVAQQRSMPVWRRAVHAAEIFARRQYRTAMADILGKHWVRGYARLSFAAIFSPSLTNQRIMRSLRGRRADKQTKPVIPAPSPKITNSPISSSHQVKVER